MLINDPPHHLELSWGWNTAFLCMQGQVECKDQCVPSKHQRKQKFSTNNLVVAWIKIMFSLINKRLLNKIWRHHLHGLPALIVLFQAAATCKKKMSMQNLTLKIFVNWSPHNLLLHQRWCLTSSQNQIMNLTRW